MTRKVVWFIDGICAVVFVFLMVFIFALSSQQQTSLAPLFSIIYRTGAWIIGAGLILTCLLGRGKSGSILGVIMLLFYLISTFLTLFGIMALTSGWELLWYIHPLLIIPGCFIALLNKKEK